MYAIVKTGGKQYRVEEGQSLLVERLPVDDGGKAMLQPLLYVDGSTVVDGEDLAKVSIEARVVGHERGPKLRIVKFKPKRGYKRRTGHRQELTRLEVTSIKLGGARRSAGEAGGKRSPKPVAAQGVEAAEAPEAVTSEAVALEAQEKPTRSRARKPPGEKPPGEKPPVEKAPVEKAPVEKAPVEKAPRPRSKAKADEPKSEDSDGA